MNTYKEIIRQNIDSNQHNPSAKTFFKNAIKKANNDKIKILSISDSSTVGIKDINKEHGRWHGLIKMVGKGSQEQRNLGGTFGIGKGAPFVCSDLRTILYNTKNIQNESAFIWKSIFTTHGKPKKRGFGYFCDYSIDKSSEILTNGINNSDIRPSFVNRDHIGTDLYILGFKAPRGIQPWNILFQRTILNNYFIALYDNELRVIITDETEGRTYEINSSNVVEKMKQDYAIHKNDRNIITNFPFLDAYTDTAEHKVEKEKIEGLGNCKLFIKLNKDYNKRIGYMRLLKMLVYTKQNPRLNSGYCALFLCENKNGNKFLSKCEDPTHSEWEKGWHPNAEKAGTILLRISKFINKVLKGMITETYSSETILGGLEKFTYSDESTSHGQNGEIDKASKIDKKDSFQLEDFELEMNDLDYKIPKPERKKKRKRKVKVQGGVDTGEEYGIGSGGPGTEGGGGDNPPGNKGFGEFEGKKEGQWKMKRIPKSQYSYKCFQEANNRKYKLVISTKNDQSCFIKFFAVGVELNKNEEIYLIEAIDKEKNEVLDVFDNIVKNVQTTPKPKTIEISFVENRKFGIEIELYA